MTLMLVMMFSSVGIGLFARRFGAGEQIATSAPSEPWTCGA